MESEIMIDAQVIAASIVAATPASGIRGAGITAVYARMSARTDVIEARVEDMHVELLECHKLHASTTEELRGIQGWRKGFADATEKNGNSPAPPAASDTDTA